jgi:uncharacterized coiled-coil DUF342 family protein
MIWDLYTKKITKLLGEITVMDGKQQNINNKIRCYKEKQKEVQDELCKQVLRHAYKGSNFNNIKPGLD